MVLFLFYMTSLSTFAFRKIINHKLKIINHKSLSMEHGLLAKSPRIEVVDALRGFAVMAIMLLHNIEHFNFYDFPTASSAFMEAMDKGIWETLFFLFSGKAYAIFSLLFGFSFFIQYNNQAKKGKDFRLRFLWRLFLLFIIGCFNGAFFPGDILVLYSIIGVVLVLVCRWSDRAILIAAIILKIGRASCRERV